MKSINGQIDVVLLNKDSVSSSPVVLPVPPPEDLLQSAKIALSSSAETESSVSLGHASAKTERGPRSKQTATEDMQSSSTKKTEPKRTDKSRCEYFTQLLNCAFCVIPLKGENNLSILCWTWRLCLLIQSLHRVWCYFETTRALKLSLFSTVFLLLKKSKYFLLTWQL